MHCNEASQRPVYHYRIVMHHNGAGEGQWSIIGLILHHDMASLSSIYDICLFLSVFYCSKYFWETNKIIITKHSGKSES